MTLTLVVVVGLGIRSSRGRLFLAVVWVAGHLTVDMMAAGRLDGLGGLGKDLARCLRALSVAGAWSRDRPCRPLTSTCTVHTVGSDRFVCSRLVEQRELALQAGEVSKHCAKLLEALHCADVGFSGVIGRHAKENDCAGCWRKLPGCVTQGCITEAG